MKVGIITYRCGGPGGIESIALSVARAVKVNGHEVHVVCADPVSVPPDISVTRVAAFANPTTLRHLSFRMTSSRAARSLGCDVIHSFGMTKFFNVFAAQSCHKAGLKTLQRYVNRLIENPFGRGAANALALWQERQNFSPSPAKKIIACSRRTKNEIIEEYKIDEDQITVIPNGIDPKRFCRTPQREEWGRAMLRSAGIPDSVPTILFVANEFARKGLAALIQSLPLLKGISPHILVAGNGNSQPYRQLALRLGIDSSVHFLGSVMEVECLYAAADLFVLPTLHEAFGLAISEAMAMGMPVIASACAGVIETIGKDGINCLALHAPEEPEDIAAAIQLMLDDSELRNYIAQAAVTTAQRFPWNEIALQIIEVYKQTISHDDSVSSPESH
ncbi:MAG: glycosyltransferase family 4 protein [Bacteroidota bacterium]